MKRGLIVVVVLLGVWACGSSAGDAQSAADTLTRRQKDSLIATMPIPGASGVGRALDRGGDQTLPGTRAQREGRIGRVAIGVGFRYVLHVFDPSRSR